MKIGRPAIFLPENRPAAIAAHMHDSISSILGEMQQRLLLALHLQNHVFVAQNTCTVYPDGGNGAKEHGIPDCNACGVHASISENRNFQCWEPGWEVSARTKMEFEVRDQFDRECGRESDLCKLGSKDEFMRSRVTPLLDQYEKGQLSRDMFHKGINAAFSIYLSDVRERHEKREWKNPTQETIIKFLKTLDGNLTDDLTGNLTP